MFAVRRFSSCMVRRRLQQHGLSASQPLLRLLLAMHHRKWQLLLCAKEQRLIQKRHNVAFSDESRFCVQYFDGHERVRWLPGEYTLPACIRYRHRESVNGTILWATIWYTARKSLIRINGMYVQGRQNYSSTWDNSCQKTYTWCSFMKYIFVNLWSFSSVLFMTSMTW